MSLTAAMRTTSGPIAILLPPIMPTAGTDRFGPADHTSGSSLGIALPPAMAYQLTFDDPGRDTNTFYRRTLHVLSDARVPFLVGGSHAILHYTGIIRETKDFDLFVRRADLDKALESLALAGYWTQVTFPHWLAKAKQGGDHVDLVFSSGNGICRVDDAWFEHAVEAEVLGMPVKIAPVEELLWQKSFVMERERYDGADIMHIVRTCAEAIDWARLMHRFEQQWQVVFNNFILFGFVYPSGRHS